VTDRPILLHLLFGAEVGGCETSALAMIKYLPSMQHRVIVFGNDGPMAAVWRAAGASVEFSPRQSRLGYRQLMEATRRAAEGAAAAMLWHGLVHLPPMIRTLNKMGIPTGVYGGNPAYSMPWRADWKFVVLGKIYPPSGPLPIYICCSQYVANSFKSSRYLRRFPRAVVPNGVEMPPVSRHSAKPYSPDRPFVMGMVARLNSIKDHATLIRAFAFVRQRFPNVELELAGDGELLEELTQLAKDLDVAAFVRFLGNVADVYGRIANWDLFTFATTEQEGMGSAIAEAMMLGLPCVVTEIGPTRDFAGDGPQPAVKLVPPRDPVTMAKAITALIPDISARSTLSIAGYEYAMTRFHPQAFARAYARHLGLPEPRS
jgi:glycosyltransferase involved in cell wall biosynthesis